MILDLDAGNTKLKWALHQGDIYSTKNNGQIARSEISAALAVFDSLPIERIRLASVVGDCTEAVCRWGAERGVSVEIARVADRTAGIICGYQKPESLGIDRWMGMIAARKLCAGAYAVVSAGTALTMDLVDDNNRHRGGFIAPGLRMMIDSLGANTWGVRVASQDVESLSPGTTTSEAVVNGCLLSAMGLIDRVMADCHYRTLFLTGGDAETLAVHLVRKDTDPYRMVLSSNLVLAGLSVALP